MRTVKPGLVRPRVARGPQVKEKSANDKADKLLTSQPHHHKGQKYDRQRDPICIPCISPICELPHKQRCECARNTNQAKQPDDITAIMIRWRLKDEGERYPEDSK